MPGVRRLPIITFDTLEENEMTKNHFALLVLFLVVVIISPDALSQHRSTKLRSAQQSPADLRTLTGRVVQVIHHPNVGALVEVESGGKLYQFGLGTINNRDPGIQITKAWESTLNKLKQGDEVTIEYNELQGYYGLALRVRLNRQSPSAGASQSERNSPVKKSAVVTYQGKGPEQGMYKWGTDYYKIDGEVKLFAWDSDPHSPTRGYDKGNKCAERKGAVWRIVYSPAIRGRDPEQADFHLWSATCLNRAKR
jgi:hypothetical protein